MRVAGKTEGAEEEEDRDEAQAPVQQLPGNDVAEVVLAIAEGGESLRELGLELFDALRDPRDEGCPEEEQQPEEDQSCGRVAESPAVVERRQARALQDVDARQHVLRQRPEHEAAGDAMSNRVCSSEVETSVVYVEPSMRCFARYSRTTSPPRAGMIALTPVPAT